MHVKPTTLFNRPLVWCCQWPCGPRFVDLSPEHCCQYARIFHGLGAIKFLVQLDRIAALMTPKAIPAPITFVEFMDGVFSPSEGNKPSTWRFIPELAGMWRILTSYWVFVISFGLLSISQPMTFSVVFHQ